MNVKKAWRCVALLGALPTCALDAIDESGEIDQEYLFQVEYVNYAWGLRWVGFVVEGDGRIFRYDHSHAPWTPAEQESFGEDELHDKYSSEREEIGRVDEVTLRSRHREIGGLEERFFTPNLQCADAGTTSFVAFRYDPDLRRYRPVVLRQEGDVARLNTSRSGRSLAAWIRALAAAHEVEGLSLFAPDVCSP